MTGAVTGFAAAAGDAAGEAAAAGLAAAGAAGLGASVGLAAPAAGVDGTGGVDGAEQAASRAPAIPITVVSIDRRVIVTDCERINLPPLHRREPSTGGRDRAPARLWRAALRCRERGS